MDEVTDQRGLLWIDSTQIDVKISKQEPSFPPECAGQQREQEVRCCMSVICQEHLQEGMSLGIGALDFFFLLTDVVLTDFALR